MQNRLAHQSHEFVKDILASALGGVDHGCQRGISLRAPLGAEAAHDFAMNHRGPQGPLTRIVVGRHIQAMQEKK